MKWLSFSNAVWLVIYLLWITALVSGLNAARPVVVESFGTDAAQRDWDQFVEEARRQSAGEGPVKRRVPRSAEPPALVLMRDHFATCVAAAVLFGTILFLVTMLLVRGIFSSRGQQSSGQQSSGPQPADLTPPELPD